MLKKWDNNLNIIEEAFIKLKLEILSEQYDISENKIISLYESAHQFKKEFNTLTRKMFRTKDTARQAVIAAKLINLPGKHGVSADRVLAHGAGRVAATQPKGSIERSLARYYGKETKPRIKKPTKTKEFISKMYNKIKTFGD